MLLVLSLLFSCGITGGAVEPEQVGADDVVGEVPLQKMEADDIVSEENTENFEETEKQSLDALAEWESQLGEFTMTSANAYTPSEGENLLTVGEKDHAYTPDAVEEEEKPSVQYVEGEVLYARSSDVSLFGVDDVDAELAALGVVGSEKVYVSGGEVNLFGLGDETVWYRADVTIVASKDAYTEGDVEAFDAVLALRSSVGLETLNEYQLIAGDVNLDGNVDEVDASLILKKSVFLIDSFPAGSWAFVPATKSVTLTSNVATVNFTAILIGDINGSWKGSAE